MKHIYSSIDIGSDTIKIVVCELYKNKLNLLAATSYKSRGIKKGVITDVELASISIKQALSEIEQMLNIKIKKVIASVPCYNTEYSFIKGTTNIKSENYVIGNTEVLNSLESALKLAPKTDNELVTILPLDYSVDADVYISNPIGKIGRTLSSRAIMVTSPKKNIYSVVGILENFGIEVVDISLNSIGDLYSFKNNKFDKSPCAIINIGADTTVVSIYNKSVIVKSSVINMGGNDIDNDLAYMYNITSEQANMLKTKFTLAHKNHASNNEYYEIKNIDNELIKVNQFEASDIVMARLDEILNLSKKEINLLTSKRIDYIIITGGTSNIAGFEYVANDIFGKNISIGNIKLLGIRNNIYSACVGNIVYFISKLKLKNKNYSMLTENESEKLSTINQNNYNTSDSMLGKIFGYFFGE